VDFLLVLIELFTIDVTAEALRVKIDRKSAFCNGVGQYPPNHHVERDVPTNHFCTQSWANECLTTLSPRVFTQRSSRLSSRFYTENGRFVFLSPFVGLKCNVRWSC